MTAAGFMIVDRTWDFWAWFEEEAHGAVATKKTGIKPVHQWLFSGGEAFYRLEMLPTTTRADVQAVGAVISALPTGCPPAAQLFDREKQSTAPGAAPGKALTAQLKYQKEARQLRHHFDPVFFARFRQRHCHRPVPRGLCYAARQSGLIPVP